jgi:predicted dinucleotide-binding enzyme
MVSDLGFDAVVAGPLAHGVRLEPGTEPFGANIDAEQLRAMIDRFPASDRGKEVTAARR